MKPGSHFVDAGGVQLHVRLDPAQDRSLKWSEGIVILHGFTGSCESMANVVVPLTRNWPTIRIDLVGHGRSEAPKAIEPYRMHDCVDQVVGVLDALKLSRTRFLGYSMGGRVALSLGVAHPGRVRSLLLVGVSPGIADAEARAARVLADEALGRRILDEGLESFVDHWMALPLFASQKRLGDEVLSAAREQRLRNRDYALALSLRGMGSGAQGPLHESLKNVTQPVCLVAGEEDEKFCGIARELASRLADARVEVIHGAGHAAHLENAVEFGEVATRFFSNDQQQRARKEDDR